MRLGILSDTHNNIANTRAALQIFREQGVRRIYHCGDLTSETIMMQFVGWQAVFALGNVDYNRAELANAAKRLGFPAPQRRIEDTVDGVSIGMMHGNEGLPWLISFGEHRYVFHGHTHRRRDETTDKGTRVINPGALGGRQSETRSVAVLDTATDDLTFFEIEE